MPPTVAIDLPPGLEPTAWVDRRAEAAARSWCPAQRTHPGDVAWSAAQHDVDDECRSRVWCAGDASGPVLAWSRVEPAGPGVAYADVHVDPTHPEATGLVEQALGWSRGHAPATLLTLLDRERVLLDAVTAAGGREQDGPWFTHLLTDLVDGSGRPLERLRPSLPAGYRVRAVTDDEADERVEVHRASWAPARIKRLAGQVPDGEEAGSRFSRPAYDRVRATRLYRRELDLVVEAPDGRLAATALGWFDERSRSGLIEPVGTAPSHATRGLARAACAQLIRELARIGARTALVCPRGDAGYPIPARLYRSLGMVPVARTRTFRLGSG